VIDPEVLEGGGANRGNVVRIGDRVHRPRRKGADAAESLLLHLESVGFAGSPRFLGHDDEGRQVLSFIEGEVHVDQRPPWVDDDDANARVLGRIATLTRDLHEATAGFVPPAGAEPFRQLPLPGDVWNHADVHYGNTVFAGDTPIAFIDWECCAPANRTYDPATLLLSARNPRPNHAENERRARSALLAADAILDGYGATDEERASFRFDVATMLDDVAVFVEREDDSLAFSPAYRAEAPTRFRWLADWWRQQQP
jgi:hypothetical protein